MSLQSVVMRFRSVLLILWMMLCVAAPVLAQMDCPALVEGGISTLAANCRNLETNTVCYGSDLVESTFAADAPAPAFDSPGDRAFLSQFLALHALPADLDKRQWGIAAVRANVPLDNSDTAVTFLLMGDTTLNYARTPLPIGGTSPAQLFQFTSASGASACAETPSTLAVQGAANTQFSLNDASIRFAADGIIALQQQSANSLTLTVESGQIEVSADGTGEPDQIAQAGQTLAAITDNAGAVLLWSAARAMTDEEAFTAGIVVEAFVRMSGEPLVLEPEAAATPEAVAVGAPVTATLAPTAEAPVVEEPILPCGPSVVHVVQRGENTFRIALRYGTTVDAIAAANNLANPRLIHAGLQLLIPCPGTVTYTAPPAAPPTTGVGNPAPASGTCGSYVVATGDTLYSIALRFGTTVEALAAANGITNINAISIGQVLVIPCGTTGTSAECAPFIAAGIPCP